MIAMANLYGTDMGVDTVMLSVAKSRVIGYGKQRNRK